ncbi:MAG: hypothetical protein E7580_01245 [Ruminococcaceae bacterium]|nr:hypothetical protein [Oscillospiraceae bacterium]
MKKFRLIALVLALSSLITLLPGCAEDEKTTATAVPQKTEEKKEEAKKPEQEYLPNRLRRADVEAFPIVTEDMSIEDRRQLAIDFFNLQLTFHWTSNMEIKDYHMTYGKSRKKISPLYVYGGIPYQSKGMGSLYRWLEYYDEETAVMDLERAFAENGGYGEENGAMIDQEQRGGYLYKKYRCMMTFFNQCSWGSFWGWARTVNSANFNGTAYMTLTNGFIPVGYTYPNMEKIDQFGVQTANNPTKYDTVDVIRDWNAANGEDGMFKCYAQLRPADLLVSSGHTMMVREVQMKKLPDGSIDYANSVVICLEQPEAWRPEQIVNGKYLYYQGETECPYTFTALQKQTYIPFTFAEFLDPADEGDKKLLDLYTTYAVAPFESRYKLFSFTREEIRAMSGAAVEKSQIFTNLPEGTTALTFAQLSAMNIGSNYTVSDVFVTVKDKDGNVLKENVYRATVASLREVSMTYNNSTWTKDENGNYRTMTDGIQELATGENTVEIRVQLSNGEKPTVFSGALLP